MRKKMLESRDLCFGYEEQMILESVSFDIFEREFIGVFGPNGGGKTTLFKLLLGFLKPQKGSLLIAEEVRHAIGYVPQNLQFDRQFPITCLEVVMMGCLSELTPWGRYPAKVKEKALHALERVGLRDKAAVHFGTLSGGQAQRVLIARAIVNTPALLLLDEPTASVDAQAEQAIYELLVELNQKMTILMVTHDLQTIVGKVQRLMCVQGTVSLLQPKEVCEHFALGLYHTPLSTTPHFRL